MMDWITSRLLEVNIGACWGTLIQGWSVSEPKLHPRDCTCTLCGLRSDPENDREGDKDVSTLTYFLAARSGL